MERLKKLVKERHNERLNKIEFALFKLDDTPTIFQQIDLRFDDVDVRHAEDRTLLETEIKEIRDSTADFRFLVKTNEEKIFNVDRKIESFRESLEEAVADLKVAKVKFLDTLERDVSRINNRLD
jgi:DnaJ-domain-containing protein 1